jgi:hypothetical protein
MTKTTLEPNSRALRRVDAEPAPERRLVTGFRVTSADQYLRGAGRTHAYFRVEHDTIDPFGGVERAEL